MSYLITFLRLIAPVRVGEVDVTRRLLHDVLYVVAAASDHVTVVRVRHVHLQRHARALYT